jgi:flagellar biosynthesis activator protein FlaF
MRNAAQAYGNVAKQTSSPREMEADLLLKAASRLQAVQDSLAAAADQARTRSLLDEALLFNRKLWTVFLTTATHGDNPLPAEIRQNVANIGIYVMKQTLETISDPRAEQLNSLIRINRELAAGLMGRA